MESHAASTKVANTRKLESSQSSANVLNEDGKLSSASAATSLKYAKAHDLPSFPSAGLQMSSAGAAASLAESNKKSFEHWRPGEIPAANKAALLAKDYEMDPMWQPEMSAAGSRAAILAHREGARAESNKEGKLHENRSVPSKPLSTKSTNANTSSEVPSDSHRKALMAAAGAMSGSRRRAGSAPIQPKDDRSWAMKAAAKSHNDGGASPPLRPFASGDPGFEAARIQNIARSNVSRQMYSSTPPVAIEVEEKNRQAMLKASAVAMAQKMYAIQQQHIDEAAAGGRKSDGQLAAINARGRTMSTGSSGYSDASAPAARYENLEEAARRLAQERLAKLHDEHAEYRSYYGTSSSPRARLSNRLRRRASSGAKSDDSDEEQSRRIRSQMSIFQSKLAEVDNKKRQADRDALLEAAHRNVDARMRKMDDKVFQETGKASPAQMEKWEKAAREKAQRESDARMQNVGKVHIGGGKYLDQSEVDAIAKARLQPTLDDINDKAEKQRARDEEIRLEQERVKLQSEREKKREAEVKAELKASNDREREEERQRKAEEKRVSKEQAAAEKERARLEKEEKRRSKDNKGGRFSAILGRSGGAAATGTAVGGAVGVADASTPDTGTATVHDQVTKPAPVLDADVTQPAQERIENDGSASEESSVVEAHYIASSPTTKSESKVTSWLKKPRFRSGTKGRKEEEEEQEKEEPEASGEANEEHRASSDHDEAKPDSIRDVALAGRTSTRETEDMYGADEPVSPIKDTPVPNRASRSPSISSMSNSDKEGEHKVHTIMADKPQVDDQEESRGRKGGFRRRLIKKIKPGKEKGKSTGTQSELRDDKDRKQNLEPTTTNTDDEAFEEARDTFQEEKLAPPPPLSSVTAPSNGGRGGSPRGSHERSRFTEEL